MHVLNIHEYCLIVFAMRRETFASALAVIFPPIGRTRAVIINGGTNV